jgi:ABC-type lipoprotein release transport system permease subunit
MLLRLALRNLGRNRRRSLLTLSAMVVSSALLILALGVFSGMLQDMLSSATEQYQGHLVVSSNGYQDDRDMFDYFSADAGLRQRLLRVPGVLAAAPRLRSFGLVSHRQSSYPAELLGIEPDLETQVTTLQDHLVAGSYLPQPAGDAALIGAGLAKRLGVRPGDELVFLTQAADGSIGNDLLQISGIFDTGDTSHDNSLLLVGLPWLQRVTALPGQVHEFGVRVADPLQASILRQQLQHQVPDSLRVYDWGELLPEMREAIASFDVSRMIVVLILYFATGLGILNTFFMAVMERTREFGILMALGMRPWSIRLLVLLESLLLGLFSLVTGVLVGLLLTWYMATRGIDLSGWITPVTYAGGTILPRLHAEFAAYNLVVPAGLLLVICLAAGFLPANRAARLRPVEALRED